jgi:hypothetical protein
VWGEIFALGVRCGVDWVCCAVCWAHVLVLVGW